MSICAIVPVKPLYLGKSRLSAVLTELERINLNRRLFENTLKVLKETRRVTQIIVISHDAELLTLAYRHGVCAIREEEYGLNKALEKATKTILNTALRSVVIIPTDLPLINPEDLDLFIKESPKKNGIGIVHDRRCEGTNMLMVSPPGCIEYQFGKNSYQNHIHQAKNKELKIKTIRISTLEFDLDLPEDYQLLFDRGYFASWNLQNNTVSDPI